MGAVSRPTRKGQLLLAERFHGRGGGAGAPKRLEEGAEGLLDLPIRIQTDAPGGVVHEADGQRDFELAAAGLVHDAAAEPRPQHMQLRFTHRPLQAEQQPIVEMRRIVEAVLIQIRVSVSAQISSSRCQSIELRAKRETSKPITSPARPRPTSRTSC